MAKAFRSARRNGGHYFTGFGCRWYSIIKTIREALVANRFKLIFGILNSTSNYILTRMEREGLSFDATLGDAARLRGLMKHSTLMESMRHTKL